MNGPEVAPVAVIGRGRVGTALADALGEVALAARALPETISATVYLICVRDPELGATARAVLGRHRGAPPVLLHTAGGVPSSVLRDAGAPTAAMLHPMIAFAGRAPRLAGALFAIEGDAAARTAAHGLCARLGGVPFELQAEQLPVYHAACALASNHVLGLVALGRELLVGLGVDGALAERGLGALFGGVADNLAGLGLAPALTGPIVRGDADAVAHHLVALASHPEALAAYRATAAAVLSLARSRGTDPEALALIARLLLL